MSNYFSHIDWISNSFLKKVKGSTYPPNIERIFEFGSLAHACIFEPEKANKEDSDYSLAQTMRDTFFRDWLCKSIMEYKNIRCEHEFYRKIGGIKRRCKADTSVRDCGLILEFKGLSVTNEKQFRESISHFDYDMGAAFYIDTSGFERELIVGVSKKKPNMLFKFMIEKGDKHYLRGRDKYLKAISQGLLSGIITSEFIYDPDLLQNLIEPCYNQTN